MSGECVHSVQPGLRHRQRAAPPRHPAPPSTERGITRAEAEGSPRASQRGDGVRVGGQAGRGRAVSGVEPSSLRDLDTDVGGTGYAYGFIH